MPPIHRKNLYSLQYSMLPVQRATISELWQLLTGERKTEGVGGSAYTNGYGHVGNLPAGKKSGNGKLKGANGYWWSR